MLNHIHIRNFAIIEELSMDLSTGLTVVTGETGAGKSIMIDAIGLALGDRADSGSVRHGAKKAEITLTLDLDSKKELIEWLEEHDLDNEEQCILRRIISQDGRSRGYINGTPTTLGSLKELGEQLVNIHGQHAHQLLIKAQNQRQLLDSHAGIDIELKELANTYKNLKKYETSLNELIMSSDERRERLDLLTFQTQELSELALQNGEIQKLDELHRKLAHADSLLFSTEDALQQLYDNDDQNVYQTLNHIIQSLSTAASIDPEFNEVVELLSSTQIQAQEAVEMLRNIGDGIESDPKQLVWADARIATISDLARKHHVSPEELPQKLEELMSTLHELDQGDLNTDTLKEKIKEHQTLYATQAAVITSRREKAAKEMSTGISESMQGLGMEGGHFEIALHTLDDTDIKPWGKEEIEFLVAANPGQPGGPIGKVASGGELSRISLAIQLIAAKSSNLPTMIFDEVDSGIGGAVAEIVGQQLRTLGQSSQVFCVTHLAQVAAQGHQHLEVLKTKDKNSTETRIIHLNKDERIQETARMLGGTEITDKTLEHAKEMLNNIN